MPHFFGGTYLLLQMRLAYAWNSHKEQARARPLAPHPAAEWQGYLSSEKAKPTRMAVLEGWEGLGWAGRWGRPFGVWKMCSAVVAIRANLQLVLLTISIVYVDGRLFWILFCVFGSLSQGEGVARCHLPVHRQSKQTVLVILKPVSLGVTWVNICPKFGTDQMSRVQSRVGQSALPVSLHGFVLLTLGQLFHVTHKKPG